MLRALVMAGVAVSAMPAMAGNYAKDAYLDYDGGTTWLPADDGLSKSVSTLGSSKVFSLSTPVYTGLSFAGVGQADLRNLLGGSFIPPDTMGAVGASQFMEMTNGVYAVYNKTSGALMSQMRADTFWTAAGATGGLNGDARLLFDSKSQKWMALQFGASVSDIQIAVSTTSDALGPWKSTKFTGYAGGTADFPTLAIDNGAVYIGTNNYNAANHFAGTTLNVISRDDLFGATPTAANVKQFVTPYTGSGLDVDRGFAIQGVNSTGPHTGQVIAASLFSNDSITYKIANPGTAGATAGPVTYLGLTNYEASNGGGRQPDGTRNIDPSDQRIGSNAWEHDGKIYSVYTATPVGGDHTEVRYTVIDAATNAVVQEGSIADGVHDFYQGSLSINKSGQVVIGFNRSGESALDGNVSVMARTFNSTAGGALVQTGELLLHVSPIDDYHNGSKQGFDAVGRQRWGDYSAVTVDPNNDQNFWVIGQYGDYWNNAAGGHPGGSGGSNWGTWIAEVTVSAVPEPETYAMLLAGLVLVGLRARRRSGTPA